MAFIDFFPYFSCWTVHHQVDWLLGSKLCDYHPNFSPRVHLCSHHGSIQCAVSRDFCVGTDLAKAICSNCQNSTRTYFSDFHQALSLVSDSNTDLQKISLDELKDISNRCIASPIIKECLNNLFKDIDQLSELTSLTHFRISRLDLEKSDGDIKNTFAKTIAVEAINIAYNWSLDLPSSVVLFNGRLSPYIAPYYLAKKLNIPIYIHERGVFKEYSLYFNEYPSTGLCAQSVSNRLSSSAISFSNVSDQQLIEVLNNRLSELHVPNNYPNLFSSDKASSTDNAKTPHHDILYIVSSEDEADSLPEANLSLAQRSAIRKLIELADLYPELSFAIKSHPNIYGAKGYPGMSLSAKHMDGIERECALKENIVVYGRESSVNPFSLVKNADLLIGLHSSLLEFGWFHGKYIVTHPTTETNAYANCIVDFNLIDSLKNMIDQFLCARSSRCRNTYLDVNTFKYVIVKCGSFDVSFGTEVSIDSSHFSPLNSIDYLKSLSQDVDYKDLQLVLDSIVNGTDINLELFSERFCNVN